MKATLLIILLLPGFAFADIIDLGSIEIDGEVRRPLIEYTGTKLTAQKAMQAALGRSQDQFVSSLAARKVGPNELQINHDINDLKVTRDFKSLYDTMEPNF